MKWLTEIPDKINKNIRMKKEARKIFIQNKRVLLKSKLEQMEIVYNSNKAKKFYQEVNSIRRIETTDIIG